MFQGIFPSDATEEVYQHKLWRQEDICHGVVDKYIEFDPVLIFLDAFLLKRQAFRHVLYNTNIQSHWKLTLVFMLCDAYTKLFRLKGTSSETVKPDYVFYSALEWNLYVMFFMSCAELAVALMTVYGVLLLVKRFASVCNFRFSEVLRGLLLSNFGKLLVVPAILWGQSDSRIYLWLTKAFVLGANIQAIKVVSRSGAVVSMLVVCVAHLAQLFTADQLHQYLSTSGIG